MHSTLSEIQKRLISNEVPGRKEFMKKMIPGSQKTYGVGMPILNALAREYQTGGVALVEILWASGAFEERMLAVKILVRLAKNQPDLAIKLTRQYSMELSDWAICDTIGMGVSKALMKKHKDRILELSEELLGAPLFWQRRLGLVLLECFAKDPEMHSYIEERVQLLSGEKEHYIKKAVVWLRSAMEKKAKKKL
jgi:3-methyladenine DNA glycosylase AlkD